MEVVVLWRIHIDWPFQENTGWRLLEEPLTLSELVAIMPIQDCKRRAMPHCSVTRPEESLALDLSQVGTRSHWVYKLIVLLRAPDQLGKMALNRIILVLVK